MESLKKNVADFGTKIRDGAQKFAADHEQEINSAKAKAGEWKAKAAGALKKGNRQAKPEDEGDSAAAEAAADSAGREQEPSANTTTSTTTTSALLIVLVPFGGRQMPHGRVVDRDIHPGRANGSWFHRGGTKRAPDRDRRDPRALDEPASRCRSERTGFCRACRFRGTARTNSTSSKRKRGCGRGRCGGSERRTPSGASSETPFRFPLGVGWKWKIPKSPPHN
mmetsp:Transcript_6317/g.15653  ORF Transcript_6317/g.15653 Transcript_6317/m.15653 type:complete len:223 (+) Transcript_6317:149-817(+)